MPLAYKQDRHLLEPCVYSRITVHIYTHTYISEQDIFTAFMEPLEAYFHLPNILTTIKDINKYLTYLFIRLNIFLTIDKKRRQLFMYYSLTIVNQGYILIKDTLPNVRDYSSTQE